jgi:hypothetical protein
MLYLREESGFKKNQSPRGMMPREIRNVSKRTHAYKLSPKVEAQSTEALRDSTSHNHKITHCIHRKALDLGISSLVVFYIRSHGIHLARRKEAGGGHVGPLHACENNSPDNLLVKGDEQCPAFTTTSATFKQSS